MTNIKTVETGIDLKELLCRTYNLRKERDTLTDKAIYLKNLTDTERGKLTQLRIELGTLERLFEMTALG